MKIVIITIGQPRDRALRNMVSEYLKRCQPYLPIEIDYVPEGRRASSPEKVVERESEALLKKVKERDFLVLLDERGQHFTSREFSQWLYRHIEEVHGRLVFVIGGAYGLSDKIKKKSGKLISLSEMTFPHELCLLFLSEQLYRAIAIHEGMAYHH